MTTVKGFVRNRQVLIEAPADWPEGTPVEVTPVHNESLNGDLDDDDSPAAIAHRLALMDQVEPLIMTPEEEAQWVAARKSQREFEKSHFDEWAEKLRRMWE